MSNQVDKRMAIAALISQMQQQGITPSEIATAWERLEDGVVAGKTRMGDIAPRLFATLGGIFIFSGISVYIGMFWAEMNSLMHILVTLGVSLILEVLAIISLRRSHYMRAVKPLFLIAVILQAMGWLVLIDIYFPHGNNWHYAALFIAGIMSLQQGVIFMKYRLTLLLFFSLFFAYSFAFTWFDLMDANENIVMVGMGISMMAIAQLLRATAQSSLSGFGYFLGGSLFYTGLFQMVHDTPLELLYLSATCGLIYVSTLARSNALLTVSTFAMLGYIGYFTEKHFVHSVGWPLSLVLLGAAFFGISSFALRVKRRYIA